MRLRSFESFVGLRFLRPRRKQLFLSVTTIIAIVGVMIGVATLIIVISTFSGFQDYLHKKTLEAYSHIVVLSFTGMIEEYGGLVERLEKEYPEVRAAAPFVYQEVMMSFRDSVTGAVLRGVDADSFGRVSSIGRQMEIGRMEDLVERHAAPVAEGEEPRTYPAIILGSELAGQLHVFPGDVINVITPLGEETPMGSVPKVRKFVVTGLFNLGFQEYDSKFAFIPKTEAQDFFGIGDRVTGVEIALADIWSARDVALRMSQDFGWPYKFLDWTRMNEKIFSALKLEKLVISMILCMIVLVASLNIFTVLYMMVLDKKRPIAILRSMGATARSIRRIFLVEGTFIGAVGSTLGLLVGTAVCQAQIKLRIVRLDPELYFTNTLPMKFELANYIWIATAAMLMAVLATWIPASIASRVDPVKVLRYE
ncbi:ABC transporter permease [bacterium]|nr:ABC transporter permease [bacterium]